MHLQQLFISIILLSVHRVFAIDCRSWYIDDPEKIADFTNQCSPSDATYVQLYGPSIKSIPSVVFQMSSLSRLIISSTGITRIPSDIEKLSALTRLQIIYNEQLQGPLPDSIYNLRKLETFQIYGSKRLDKGISSKIEQLTSLQSLSISHTALRGSFPSTIGALKNLNYLTIEGNNFTGNLPVGIGQCTQLQSIKIVENNFTGIVPNMFSNLTKLNSLNLRANNFSGPLPSSLQKISNKLQYLTLSNNHFTGPLPVNLTALYALDVSNTKISGSPPESWLMNSCQANNSNLCRPVRPITRDLCGPLPSCPLPKACQSVMIESQNNYKTECKFIAAPKTVFNQVNTTILRETNYTLQGLNIINKSSPEVRPKLESIFKPLCTQFQCSNSLSKNGLLSRVSRDCSANPKLVSVYNNTLNIVQARSNSLLCHTSPSNYTCATEFINTILTQYPSARWYQPEYCTPCFIQVAANVENMEYLMRSFGYDAYFPTLHPSQAALFHDLVSDGLQFFAHCHQSLLDKHYIKQKF